MTHLWTSANLQGIALAAATLLVVAGPSAIRAAAAPSGEAVSIDNFTFRQPVVTVKPGTTVTWTNRDDIPHTVVSKDALFKSKVLDTGDTFAFTFTKAGQFGYFCSLHPHMTGTVIVKA